MAGEQLEIRRLDATQVRAELDGLAAVLLDCVEGGASVGYMATFSHEDARGVYEAYAGDVEQGGRLLLAAFADGKLVGTVQVVFAPHPNRLTARTSRGCSSIAQPAGAASPNG